MTDKEKRTKKYMEDQRHKKRLERLAKDTENRYPAGAVMVEERCDYNGGPVPIKKPFVKKTNRSKDSTRYQYFKNYSNRVVRRSGNVLPKGGSYKKVFDYWWTVD